MNPAIPTVERPDSAIGRFVFAAIFASLFALLSGPDVRAKDAPPKKDAVAAKSEGKAPKDSADPAAKGTDADTKKPAKGARRTRKAAVAPAEAAAPEPQLGPLTTSTLPEAVARLVAPFAKSARWGIEIRLFEAGQTLYQLNATEGFIPASNRKVFTAALALDQLGPDFQFRTYLYRTAPVQSGVLKGSLVIRPQGDPTFSNTLWRSQTDDWVYRDWVDKVRNQGITRVEGELVVDCSGWNMADMEPQGWAKRIQNDTYAPRPSPLTLKENLLEIRVEPGAKGQPGNVVFNPAASGYPVVNNTVTGQGPAGVRVRRLSDGKIEVSGNPTAATAKRSDVIPADNPSLYAAAVFRQHLHNAGITVTGPLRIVSGKADLPPPSTENVVAVYISPKLSDIINYMMKKSNNHFAEQLYVSISAVKAGRGGYSETEKIERAFLQRAGVDLNGLVLGDGCGLSESNRVSPSQMCQLLDFMLRQPSAKNFIDALPVSGRDGTLHGRMGNSATLERVRAKTGTINHVSTLSGYVLISPGRTAIFSFLVNGNTGAAHPVQDRLCTMLCLLAP